MFIGEVHTQKMGTGALKITDIGHLKIDVHQSAEAQLQAICQKFELKYACYAKVDQNRQMAHGFTTYPKAWIDFYLSNNLAACDPVLKYGSDSVAPIDWAIFKNSPQYQKMFQSARDFKIGAQGISIPVIGPFGDRGVLSASTDLDDAEWQKKLTTILPSLRHEAEVLHLLTLDALDPICAFVPEPLSAQEREILHMVATGFPAKAIACRRNMSSRTLEITLSSIKTKFRSKTMEQAVGRALANDVLKWSDFFADPVLEIADSRGEYLIGGIIRWSNTLFEVIPFEWHRRVRNSEHLVQTTLPVLSDDFGLNANTAAKMLELPIDTHLCVRSVR